MPLPLISAARAVRVVEPHLEITGDAPHRCTADDETVRTDATGAMAEPARERGSDIVRHRDDVVGQQHEEVVAEPVVLAQVHQAESPRMLSTDST